MNKKPRQLPRTAVVTGSPDPIWMQGCEASSPNVVDCLLVDSDGEPIPAYKAAGEGNVPVFINDGITNTVHKSTAMIYRPQDNLAGLRITFDPALTIVTGWNVVLPRATNKYRSSWGGTLSTFFGKIESH